MLGKPKGKGSRRRARERKAERFVKQFHSKARVEWTKGQKCVCNGAVCGWDSHLACQNSHDPSRGAGGTYLDITPMSFACHRKLEENAPTYWKLIGKTREEASTAHQAAWLEYSEGLAE